MGFQLDSTQFADLTTAWENLADPGDALSGYDHSDRAG